MPGVVDEPGTVDDDAAPAAAEAPVVGKSADTKKRPRLRLAGRLVAFAALVLGVGALAGVAWWAVVEPPAYLVNAEGGASISERGLTEFIGGDAWFCAIGLVVGIAVGLGAWRWFHRIGWPVVLLACGMAFLAGLTCWFVGYRLGPGDFSARLAVAQAGDLVPIELTLRARASLLVWPFCAVIPILLGSSLGRDDEEPQPLFRRRAAATAAADSGSGQPEN